MKIDFVRSGGFAGLRLAVNVDTQTLPADQSAALEKLIRDSGFFNLPEQIKSPSGGADRFEYRLTISDAGRSHSVTVSEAAMPESLRPLIDRLTEMAKSPR
ncbi:MAG: hypothetical protein HY258_10795 [Chloroflexi bacterium]|nr:hypothetical protein [Chloroflexota bacterium]